MTLVRERGKVHRSILGPHAPPRPTARDSYNLAMSFTPRPRLALIAAVAANGINGRNGTMPWHLSVDLKYFLRALHLRQTHHHGSSHLGSIPLLLPNREHVVVLRRHSGAVRGCDCRAFAGRSTGFAACCGATRFRNRWTNAMYREALLLTDDLYLTEIETEVDGDATFPTWDRTRFREVSRERHSAPLHAGGSDVPSSFVHYVRA